MKRLDLFTVLFLLTTKANASGLFVPKEDNSKYIQSEIVERPAPDQLDMSEKPYGYNFDQEGTNKDSQELKMARNTGLKGLQEYTTQGGETLVWIAYKLLGDVSRWRELYALNRDYLPADLKITEGMYLYYPNEHRQFMEPDGNPYYVKDGDTLTAISKKVYGDSSLWRSLWQNNKEQIFGGDGRT